MIKELSQKDELTEFLLYKSPNDKIKVDVFLHNETIWLSQKKRGKLFGVDRTVITKPKKKIYLKIAN